MSEEKEHRSFLTAARQLVGAPGRVLKPALFIAVIAVLAFMFPRGASVELEYKIGAVWASKDLIAPFSFPILRDDKEYQHDVDLARTSVYTVFERDTMAGERQVARLGTFFSHAKETIRLREQFKRSPRKRGAASEDSLRYIRAASALDIPFSEREWDYLTALDATGALQGMEEAIVPLIRTYLNVGLLDSGKATARRSEVAVRTGTNEEIIPLDRLYDRADIIPQLEVGMRTLNRLGPGAAELGYKIGITFLTPNVQYSPGATQQALNAAQDAVPRTLGFVQENERVVSKHERITPEIKLKLDSLRRAKADRGTAADSPLQILGAILHVSLVLSLYTMYIRLFRKRIYEDIRRLSLIALLILLVGALAYFTRELDVNAPLEFLICVPAVSMILTIVFDSRVGFYGTVIVSLLVAGIRGNDYSIALASVVAGALSVYSVRDMKNRSQIFRSLLFIALGYGLSILALDLERFEPLGVMLEQFAYGVGNAIISPMLTYGLLVFLERFFRVTTDLTLLELAQFNHPLLRMLSEQAPGTYHHSMTMASLAEAGAAAIGANEVLARVAGYFHDIGKIVKPTYFAENQKGSRNRHDKLAPRMSSLIIAAHVKDGMALAREYKLPAEVIDFIPMHHGTTRIDFFYNKAVDLAQHSPDETKLDEINEQDYRYPGPRPQTRETGIMMLADTIEAAVRTLDDPTPQRLEETIDQLVKKRADEGQLDECPLTLRDLKIIKEAFLGILVGIYHTRVKYPETERKRTRKPPPTEQPPVETDDRITQGIKEIDRE
jgi:cyclic-di-AMP phosphodiesterase PgpH